jgi:hypothetical protein
MDLVESFLAVAVLSVFPTTGAAETFTMSLGGRSGLGHDAGTPQLASTVSFSIVPSTWPVGPELYVSGSHGSRSVILLPPGQDDYSDGEFETTTLEGGLGVRREWGRRQCLHLSAGVALAEVQGRSRITRLPPQWNGPVVRGHDVAPWVGTGISWPVGSHIGIGIAARFSAVNVEDVAGYEKFQGGGIHLGIAADWIANRSH